MSVTIDGQTKRIGLALSGGGFRAAAFHLAVFRKLASMGILWKVDLLSCVSGGSIAGGFLAANWNKTDALDRLEQFLRTRSLAVSSFLKGLVNPFSSRLEKLADGYDEHLYAGLTLNGLGSGPRLYLNATNLSTGNMFFFVTGGGKPAEMGEHETGVVPAGDFPLCKAVAASSAFPPVFPPLKLDKSIYNAAGVDYVTLTDGGVYDNLGVNPVFRARNSLDYVIVSDAGKPFELSERPTRLGTRVVFQSIDILMEQVRGLQFKRLELSAKAGEGPKPLWFSIDSRLGQSRAGDAQAASKIDTNLKKLTDEELTVLGRHAQALLQHRIDTYAPELMQAR